MLTLELGNVAQTLKMFSKVGEALDEDRIADEAGAVLLNRIRTRFLAEEDPEGKKWQESLSAKNRRKSGRGGGTLFNTGRLFHSIQLFRRGSGVRAIGTDVPYAKKHQEGLGEVQRTFIGASNADINLLTGLILKRIEDAIK